MRTKICGIRSQDDLRIALRAGADAIGLICGINHRSEDEVTPEFARSITRAVPPFVSTVLVTHRDTPEEILELADLTGVSTIQVHGIVTLDTLTQVRERAGSRKVLKVIHVSGDDAIEEALEAAEHCDGLLLDSRSKDRLGGTGQTHDWSISRRIVEAVEAIGTPVILAGGLNPDNVAAAVEQVRPYGVDVNSGVDDAAGDKSPERCRGFVLGAKQSITS
ncbi:MAG: phosphoribosylanthranilate isomerase [Actinomycetales bacterium]|nr:phosphoribosylanthranilate isomerase [Actinomycetales bacterium]